MLPENLAANPTATSLHSQFPDAILVGGVQHGELTLWIDPHQLAPLCIWLKRQQGYERLSSITCVDRYPMEPRFEVVYHLHSIANNRRLRLKCAAGGEQPELASVYGVWRAADWYEREVYDMFGVVFQGHPDLRRILMPEDWQGHPLRKDFPVHGHKYSYSDD